MRTLSFTKLRNTNGKRAAEWVNDAPARLFTERLLFTSNEIGDECGEVQGAVKKMIRRMWNMPGGISFAQARVMVAEELADVIICCDLLAGNLDIDLSEAITAKFNKTSDKHGFKTKL